MMKRILTLSLFFFFNHVIHSQTPELILPLGHTDEITGYRITPDDELLITASKDGTGKIWNYRTGKLMYNLVLHKRRIADMALSSDARFVLLFSEDGTYSKWEVETGRLLFQSKDRAAILQAYLLPGDSLVAIRHKYGVYVCKVGDNEIRNNIEESWSSEALSMELSPDKSTLAIYLKNSGISFYHFKTEEKSWTEDKIWVDGGYYEFDKLKFWGLHFASDSEVVVRFQSFFMCGYNVNNGKEVFRTTTANEAAFSNDGQYMAMLRSHTEDTVFIWDYRAKKIISHFSFPRYESKIIGFSKNGKSLLVYNKGLQEWSLDGKLIRPITLDIADENKSVYVINCDWQRNIIAANDTYEGVRGRLRIWDLSDGSMVNEFAGKISALNEVEMSRDGQYIFEIKTAYANYWDLRTGKSNRLPTMGGDVVRKVHPLSDGKRVLLRSYSHIGLYDISTNRIIYEKELKLLDMQVTDGDSILITSDGDNMIRKWRMADGRLLSELTFPERVKKFSFSPDMKYLAGIYSRSAGYDTIFVWNTGKNDFITKLAREGQQVERNFGFSVYTPNYNPTLFFSPDSKTLFYNYGEFGWTGGLRFEDDVIEGQDTLTYEPQQIFYADGTLLPDNGATVFHKRNKSVFFTKDYEGGGGFVQVCDYEKGSPIQKLEYKATQIILEVDEQKNLLYTLAGGELLVWDLIKARLKTKYNLPAGVFGKKYCLATGQLLIHSEDRAGVMSLSEKKPTYYLSTFDSGDFIAYRNDGYYLATPAASKWLSWKIRNKLYDFDQWDLQYNRPDKMIEIMDKPESELKTAFYKAYQKRLRRNGVNESMFRAGYHIPETRLIDAPRNGEIVMDSVLQVKVNCIDSDRSTAITKVLVSINDNPLYGRTGFITSGLKKDSLQSFRFKLTPGPNHVRISCVNQRGEESLRQQFQVYYKDTSAASSRTWFIGIGINRFAESQYNLQWSVKDIRDLAINLKTKYPDLIVDTLFNESVTVDNVRSIRKMLSRTLERDKIILSYSGHGLLSNTYDYYLSTYSVNFEKPEINGLAYEELEGLLDSIPARQKLLLIDACHSGELDKDDLSDYFRVQHQLDSTQKGLKPVERKSASGNTKNSFELMQELFANINLGTGATIISAAAGTQLALEKGELRNGVFTYSILECMRHKRHIQLSQLRKYVYDRVRELTQGKQVPTTRNETRVIDWDVW